MRVFRFGVISACHNFLNLRYCAEGSSCRADVPIYQGKFVLDKIVGWADSFIVCPRGLVSAWAQKRAHPTFVDFKHNFFENKFALSYILTHIDKCRCYGSKGSEP